MPVGMGHADLSGMCQPVRIFHLFVKYLQKGRRVGSCGHEALFQHACCKMFPFQLGLSVMMLQCGTYFVQVCIDVVCFWIHVGNTPVLLVPMLLQDGYLHAYICCLVIDYNAEHDC